MKSTGHFCRRFEQTNAVIQLRHLRLISVRGWPVMRPALCHNLCTGEEADAVFAILVKVAESRILPAAMAVVANWGWHREIDAHHAYSDFGNETLGPASTAREDSNRVALVMEVRVAQRLLERLSTNDLQHGPEDFVLVALH